jgi:valyl-tRNA synthetase
MPFITEELWQDIKKRENGESIVISLLPQVRKYDQSVIDEFEFTKELISNIRKIRKDKNIPFKEKLNLLIAEGKNIANKQVIMKLAGIENISTQNNNNGDMISFMVNTTEFYIPYAQNIDVEAELEQLNKDLTYYQGFLNNVMKKLSNEKFVNNAPEKVVALEKKKKSDAEEKINNIKEQIAKLTK